MTNLEDLAALIVLAKTRTYSHDDVADRNVIDQIVVILADYETRIAALEAA